MKYQLFDYQDDAVATISRHLIRANRDHLEDPQEHTAVVLAAPTGAGKTVIATGIIEGSLDLDESTAGIDGATFLWVTDDPSLNRQTLQKMMDSSSDMDLGLLTIIENDFDAEIFEPGRVYFLNIQKLSANANLSKSRVDGRTFSLWETIANTITQRPAGFIVVIDEAHRGTTATAASGRNRETIVSQIIGGRSTGRPAAPLVWGISATPRRFLTAMAEAGRTTKQHTVAIEDVRASGLLKDQIVLGHTQGVDAAESALVRFAVQRVRAYDAKWAAYTASSGEPHVHPALVVQVADKPTTSELSTLLATLLEEWPGLTREAIVHTFADHTSLDVDGLHIPWCPPEDIQDRTEIRVVLCKTAITTGWDCPRAEVLLSFRVANDLDLITQIMGRMVRTPLARRIDTDQDLNAVHCILPKFDKHAVEEIAERFRAGDADTLAGGAAIITDAVELARNPTLTLPTPAVTGRQPTGGEFELLEPSTPPGAPASPPAAPEHFPPTAGRDVPSEPVTGGLFDTPPLDVTELHHAGPSVFDVISSLTSYTIPRRLHRSPVTRLMQMGILLAGQHNGSSIDPKAPLKARHALLSVIEEKRAVLEDAGELDDLVAAAGTTRLFERTVGFANPTSKPSDTTSDLTLDARGIQILMKRAAAALPEGLALAYVDRLATTDEKIRDAQLTTITLAGDPTLLTDLEARASHLVEQWFKEHASAITRLPAPDQEAFDRIRRESDRPLPTTITLPTSKTESSAGTPWPRHVLSDADGLYRAELEGWEAHVLRTELDAGALAWYRNPVGGRHSLQIPYTTAAGIRGLAPDFLFVHDVAGQLRASLIDPHGTHLADAVNKLKGLTAYAAAHAADYHRIQSIALVDGAYLMLNHKDAATREAITTFEGTESAELFRAHGSKY